MSTQIQRFLSVIPDHDEELYVALPRQVRRELDAILENLPYLLNSKSIADACHQVAASIGMNTRQLYERVRKYIKTRDWKALVNKAKAGAILWKSTQPIGLPVSFSKFYQGLCENNQRVDMGGYRELMLIWKTHVDSNGKRHDTIPGYDQWPAAGRFGHPDGWSYRNLSRFSPDLYDSAATRQGPFAASLFRPPVLKTRTTLAFCERIEFDDHEYNIKIHFPGQLRAMRPRGFNAVEALSAYISPCWKPTLWDMEEEKKKALTERDMMWFVIHWLTEIGYRTDTRGTCLVVEKGTAAIRKPFADRIYKVTGERVRVSEPGMFHKASHKGQYAPRSKGNFKHKPLVEGSFSYVDNYFAGLPGQTGLSRITAPEELHGREMYLKQLLNTISTLPQERAEQIRLPLLTWRDFNTKGLDIYAAINWNPEHNLEGWAELGFHQLEWRINPEMPWQPHEKLLSLPDPERQAIESLLSSSSIQNQVSSNFPLTRARNLSRHEVFHTEHQRALETGLMIKLSPWRYCDLVGLENGWPVKVNDKSLVVIDSREFGINPIRYLATVNGRHLNVGEKYIAFVNPWSPRIALLTKQDGAAVGLIEQWEVAGDEEAQKRMAGKQAHWEAQRRDAMNERHADQAAEIQHIRDHNEALMDPTTSEERETAKRLNRAAARTKEDFTTLDTGAPPSTAPQTATLTMDELNQL